MKKKDFALAALRSVAIPSKKEFLGPSLICLAQYRCVFQNSQQIAVRIQLVLLCRLNQAVDHGAGLCAGRGVGKKQFFLPITKDLMLRSARLLLRSSLPSSR